MAEKVRGDSLINGQAKVINELQEKIRLLQFDVSKNLETIYNLKGKLERKEKTMVKVKEELELMKKENDYSNIGLIIKYIRVEDDEE